MKITKAVIPAAGLGTRFLPATKAQPKEMLPIVDKPTIQYIVEEAVKAGIEDIIFITGRSKRSIEDHFDKSYELEAILQEKKDITLYNITKGISDLANIHYIRQKEASGLGHAVLLAKSFIGNEPFAVLLGDDIVQSKRPAIGQLIECYEKYNKSVVGVQPVAMADVNKYGIVDGHLLEERVYQVNDLVEKPQISQAPSNVAILGRYVITPDIFHYLETQTPGAGGEIQLTDALKRLAQDDQMYAYHFKGKRYDVGNKMGFISATIEYALRRQDLKCELKDYLYELVKDIDQAIEYD